MVYDARDRTKVFMDTYLTAGNIKEDDTITNAAFIVQYSDPPYPMKLVFYGSKNIDVVYSVDTPVSTPHLDWKKEIYAYTETVPVHINTVDKTGITGTELRWRAEVELRRIVETYPLGSVRTLDRVTKSDKWMGGWLLHGVTYNLAYKRAVDAYTSDCTLSYGTGFIYDGDRVSGGTEGTWSETEDGQTGTFDVTTSRGSLYINISATGGNAAYYASNGTNLALSSTIYTKMRWRYKTSSASIKAKIVIEFSDASTQEILADSSSTTWTVGSATITSGKTIDHIRLHADHATGQVYYDFIQIYAADYTLPNVVELDLTQFSQNTEISIPNSVPWATQNLGAPRALISMLCDLDMETTTYDWSRAAGAKVSGNADSDAGEIFLDVAHHQSDEGYWQWLVFGNKGCRVTLDEPQFTHGESSMVRLIFHEYSDRDTSDDSYEERWDI